MTRTLTEDEMKDIFVDRIILTSSNNWNPEGMSSPCELNTTNISAFYLMKEDIPPEGLMVCSTAKRDAGYIEDGGDYELLSGVSTALTKETLLSRIIDCVNIANTTSRNRHYDISP